MDTTLVLSFLSAAILLTLMPGPDNIFVLTESITKGRRNGIIISFGLVSGIIIHTLIIATGLAILIQKSEKLFYGIKILGALYLLYLVYKTYKEPENKGISVTKGKIIKEVKKISFFSLYKKGFLMNVLNPKVTLFFIAFMPQFVTKNGFPFEIQIVTLGGIFMIQGFIILSGIAILSDKLSAYLTSKVFWKNVKWIKMCVLTGLALFLFF